MTQFREWLSYIRLRNTHWFLSAVLQICQTGCCYIMSIFIDLIPPSPLAVKITLGGQKQVTWWQDSSMFVPLLERDNQAMQIMLPSKSASHTKLSWASWSDWTVCQWLAVKSVEFTAKKQLMILDPGWTLCKFFSRNLCQKFTHTDWLLFSSVYYKFL